MPYILSLCVRETINKDENLLSVRKASRVFRFLSATHPDRLFNLDEKKRVAHELDAPARTQ